MTNLSNIRALIRRPKKNMVFLLTIFVLIMLTIYLHNAFFPDIFSLLSLTMAVGLISAWLLLNMLKSRKGRYFLISVLALLSAYWAFIEVKNRPAEEAKLKVAAEIDPFINSVESNKEISLSNIGGIEWDYICRVNAYSNGYKTARRNFNEYPLNSNNLSIADENLSDAQDGIALISRTRNLFITVSVGQSINSTKEMSGCFNAQDVLLIKSIDAGMMQLLKK